MRFYRLVAGFFALAVMPPVVEMVLQAPFEDGVGVERDGQMDFCTYERCK